MLFSSACIADDRPINKTDDIIDSRNYHEFDSRHQPTLKLADLCALLLVRKEEETAAAMFRLEFTHIVFVFAKSHISTGNNRVYINELFEAAHDIMSIQWCAS